MDVLDRLIGHDSWTTRQLLVSCRGLPPEKLDETFDIGHRTLRATFDHIIGNMEGWTSLMLQRPSVEDARPAPEAVSLAGLLKRLNKAAPEFAEIARRIQREGRADEMFSYKPADASAKLPFGGVIAHLLTHSMHHRSQILYMMKQLGAKDMIEGDALSWEEAAFGWR